MEKGGRQELHKPMGCADIQLQNNWVGEYPSMWLSTYNKGWHSQWFYLKNDAAAPLPEFTGCLIEEALEQWRKWGVSEKDKKKIRDHITTTKTIFSNGGFFVGAAPLPTTPTVGELGSHDSSCPYKSNSRGGW